MNRETNRRRRRRRRRFMKDVTFGRCQPQKAYNELILVLTRTIIRNKTAVDAAGCSESESSFSSPFCTKVYIRELKCREKSAEVPELFSLFLTLAFYVSFLLPLFSLFYTSYSLVRFHSMDRFISAESFFTQQFNRLRYKA